MNPVYALNGNETLEGVQDYTVAQLILKRVPSDSFTSVRVESVYHRFPLQNNEQRARKIIFERSSCSVGWECVKTFFTQVFFPKQVSQKYRDNPSAVNGNLVAAFLGKFREMSDEDMKNALDDLRVIYNRCMRLVIYISDDCNFVDGEQLIENHWMVNARKAGKCIIC